MAVKPAKMGGELAASPQEFRLLLVKCYVFKDVKRDDCATLAWVTVAMKASRKKQPERPDFNNTRRLIFSGCSYQDQKTNNIKGENINKE